MAARFFESAYTILIPERTEVRFNGEWLAKVDFAEVLRLTRTVTVARILERDDFAKRFAAQQAISVSELLYPLMQAYDSVAVEADIELGGTDQLYNLLDRPRRHGGLRARAAGRPDDSADRLVGRNEDERLEGQLHRAQRGSERTVRQDHASAGRAAARPTTDSSMEQEPPGAEPMEAKLALARFIVERAHGAEAANQAEEHFTRVVREGEAPADVPEAELPPGDPVHLPALLVEHLGVGSTSEARRLISQGAVKIDGRGGLRDRRSEGQARGGARPGRKAAIHAVSRRLTGGSGLLSFPGCPRGRCRTSP